MVRVTMENMLYNISTSFGQRSKFKIILGMAHSLPVGQHWSIAMSRVHWACTEPILANKSRWPSVGLLTLG